MLVWSRDAARGRGFLVRHQALLFLPLLTLLGISLKRDSIRAIHEGTVKRRRLEGGLLAAHFVLYLSALFTVLSPLQAVAFGTSGHRGSSFSTTFNDDHIAATTQAIVEYSPLNASKDRTRR